MKVQISVNDDLLKRIDNYAEENYMSRSGLISMSCKQFLDSNDVIRCIKNLDIALQKIASKGEIDSETQDKLDDFARIAKLVVGEMK